MDTVPKTVTLREEIASGIPWHVSFLTTIAGELDTVSARSIAWANAKGFYLWLDWQGAAFTITYKVDELSHKDLCAIVGYCHLNDIKFIEVIGAVELESDDEGEG
ncbi:hypothetical protein UFOVP63_51 [uncultured Caudovirales phage]|uniref:Uncharacterized protein n=1 Tax=uncultured Caudovirales phage TaxID=2100421 RepID=A0A6J5KVV8_9CAUD|nr:hypothetical protein UFOVP63_51 [uncultured Caudovirales phage]